MKCTCINSLNIYLQNSTKETERVFSSPEPNAHWWAYSTGRRPSSVLQTLPTSQKPLGQSKSNFLWSLCGMGERKFVQMVQVTWPRWPPCQYLVKILKISSPEPNRRWPWHLICSVWCSVVNNHMKFHEDILNCFKVIKWTRFCHRNYYLQSSQGL